MFRKIAKQLKPQRGDTIVEVMFALAVIGLTLGIGYGIANRAIISGRDAQERTETTKYIEAQLEKLILASSDPANGYFDEPESSVYCINDSLALVLDSNTPCTFGPDGRYRVTIVRDDNLFTITGTWQNIRSGYSNTASVVYRTYEFDNVALVAPIPPASCPAGFALHGTPAICVEIPVVTTGSVAAASITTTTATVSSNSITTNGSITITARGIAYGTLPGPTLASGFVASGSGTGSFNRGLSGLTAGTTYYARAYATDSSTPARTTYGNQITFSTLGLSNVVVDVKKIPPAAGNNTPACSAAGTLNRSGTTVQINGVNRTTGATSTATFTGLNPSTSYTVTGVSAPTGHQLCSTSTNVTTGASGSTTTVTSIKIRPVCYSYQSGTTPGYYTYGARRTDADNWYYLLNTSSIYSIPWIPPPGGIYMFVDSGARGNDGSGGITGYYYGYNAVYVAGTPIYSMACPT